MTMPATVMRSALTPARRRASPTGRSPASIGLRRLPSNMGSTSVARIGGPCLLEFSGRRRAGRVPERRAAGAAAVRDAADRRLTYDAARRRLTSRHGSLHVLEPLGRRRRGRAALAGPPLPASPSAPRSWPATRRGGRGESPRPAAGPRRSRSSSRAGAGLRRAAGGDRAGAGARRLRCSRPTCSTGPARDRAAGERRRLVGRTRPARSTGWAVRPSRSPTRAQHVSLKDWGRTGRVGAGTVSAIELVQEAVATGRTYLDQLGPALDGVRRSPQ